MNRRFRSIAVLLILIVALSFVVTGSATAEGSITILWDGYVYDINDHGQVVGREFPYNAVMWDEGELITLWENGEAKAINNRGQVMGTKILGYHDAVVMWDQGELITLWKADFTSIIWAADINNRGQVVGDRWFFARYFEALMWDKGEVITLWEGPLEHATAINNRGQVVGRKNVTDHVLWDKGEIIHLGLGGGRGPTAINDRGQVVGEDAYSPGYLWDNGEVITLPFIPLDINDPGQVVGQETQWGSPNPYRAVLWDKGELITLWEGPSPAFEARAINNRGQVVGTIAEEGTWKVVLWEK